MTLQFGARRAAYYDVTEFIKTEGAPLSPAEVDQFEILDLVYRSLCALMYNYVPTSGHPGGSISSGRLVAGILFDTLDSDISNPDRDDADIISYAAGHKALGLYAMWALRDEIARLGCPEILPANVTQRLRLEDLLGFRRNLITRTPLFIRFGCKPLDGHPTPATPFVRLSTGASGVGLASSLGLALGAKDFYGADAPRIHIVEGEGGLTPGRAAEALAAAGTASLNNAAVHVDWNQASIDSNRVCREGGLPGDYVQWNPIELFYLHDWNVISVPDGMDFQQIIAAQRFSAKMSNGQPTAIIYRTVKGWHYGIEGRESHNAGHKLCSDGFCQALTDLTGMAGQALPSCEPGKQRCAEDADPAAVIEQCYWESLSIVRKVLEDSRPAVAGLARRLLEARERLGRHARRPRNHGPHVEAIFDLAVAGNGTPDELMLKPGTVTTLRGEFGRALQFLNHLSRGAILVASADLLGSTSVGMIGRDFPGGYWNAVTNADARTLSIGGICEDAMSGFISGLSAFGHHIGVGSSYGAFLAPLGHIAARLHAIGAQARRSVAGNPYRPMILVCAHAGLKTGEDGSTHADPQALQLLQDNFPRGTAITLTPWDPREIWPLLTTSLARLPAIIAIFLTRPSEMIVDRKVLRLAPPEAAIDGVYLLRTPHGKGAGTVVLQESAVAYAFVEGALPLLDKEGLDPWVYYVASGELFDELPVETQHRIFPAERAQEAMGITGFTLPTMFRWVRSDLGRSMTLHPYLHGHFLGSAQGEMVIAEAGLDGESQVQAIKRYLDALTLR